MNDPTSLTPDAIDRWADDPRGPVALTLTQKLRAVEDGPDAVIFPPTYAEIGYAIDTLSDGTKVAQIDSVGSQANRMEPLFKAALPGQPENPLSALVPQIDIVIGGGKEVEKTVSLLEAGHRLGDALIRASGLGDEAQAAFRRYRDEGDAGEIARVAPTSLVFGAWDSRDTQAKLPRIVQSVIRAFGVEVLHRSAQFEPAADYTALGVFGEEDKVKAEKDTKSPQAQRGYVHVPAIDAPGGIIARGGILRTVTVNLVALRQLDGRENGSALRRYVLGLALVAAAEPPDAFLRQGCLLTPDPEQPSQWTLVARDGSRTAVTLTPEIARTQAERAAAAFGVGESRRIPFSKDRAKRDIAAKPKAGKSDSKD